VVYMVYIGNRGYNITVLATYNNVDIKFDSTVCYCTIRPIQCSIRTILIY